MFLCKDLLGLPSLKKAKLIAGESGLDRGIRWAYKPESMNFSKWIRGQEFLIVSSPVIQSKGFDLALLIREAVSLNVSGVLLLVGEDYIRKIGRRILEIADAGRLPLLVLPWDVPLIGIFEELGHAIAYQDRIGMEKQELLSSIIFGTGQSEPYLILQAERLDYDITLRQRLFLVRVSQKEGGENAETDKKAEIGKNVENSKSAEISKNSEINESDMKLFIDYAEEAFRLCGRKTVISCFSHNIIGITNSDETDQAVFDSVFREFGSRMKKNYPDVLFMAGVGASHDSLEDLKEGFTEAAKAIDLTGSAGERESISYYDDLGFYQVLSAVSDKRVLDHYVKQVLGKLIEYDEKNHTELIDTLKAYFQCDENIQLTAERIYSHPNTVKYRLKTIEKILGSEMKYSKTKSALYNALMIVRMKKSQENRITH